jgi:uncharacterized protein
MPTDGKSSQSISYHPGLTPIFDRSGKANLGHALETVVALEIERSGAKLSYVTNKSGSEVDFLARHYDGQQDLIQVCVDLDSASSRTREVRVLTEAAEKYPQAELHIIVLNSDIVYDVPKPIRLHSASTWFLSHSN